MPAEGAPLRRVSLLRRYAMIFDVFTHDARFIDDIFMLLFHTRLRILSAPPRYAIRYAYALPLSPSGIVEAPPGSRRFTRRCIRHMMPLLRHARMLR